MSYTALKNTTQSDFWSDTGSIRWAVDRYLSGAWSATDKATYGATANDWDVSQVTDFSSLFMQNTFHGNWGSKTDKNYDVSNWDVSAGTNFSNMVYNNTDFDYDISVWAVSSTASLTNMFSGATAMLARGFTDPTNSGQFNQVSSGVQTELQAIDDNDTDATLSNPSDNKKRLAIALARLG